MTNWLNSVPHQPSCENDLCRLHRAAPAMLELLKALGRSEGLAEYMYEDIDKVIRLADTGEES